jgi:hypothetical protein
MHASLPAALQELLLNFAPVFTRPSFANFTVLTVGWILCVGRHSLSRVIQFAGQVDARHHSAFYRFLARAVWTTDRMSLVLIDLVVLLIPEGDVYAVVDDTLRRRSGPHIWGAGMHHDPIQEALPIGAIPQAYGAGQ